MIRLTNISLKINERVLIESGNIDIPYGHVVLIKGESGCGKTTLLMDVALLSHNSKMNYEFDDLILDNGDEVKKSGIRQNEISVIFQDTYLFEHLNLIENIKFFAKMANQNISEEEIREKLDFVGLDLDFNTNIKQMSGGERQRLAIVCGLVKNAKLFIFDEPTSYLDDENKQLIMTIIKNLAHLSGKMVLVASHDLEFDKIADDIYEINDNHVNEVKRTNFDEVSLSFKPRIQWSGLLKEYVNKKSRKSSFVMGILLAILLAGCATSLIYSGYYLMTNEKEILSSVRYQGIIIKENEKPLSVSEQARIQQDILTNCYPNVELSVMLQINDSLTSQAIIRPYLNRAINETDVLKKQDSLTYEDVYLSYELHRLLKEQSFELLKTDLDLEIMANAVLKPSYDTDKVIYVPYSMMEGYFQKLGYNLYNVPVSSITVELLSLEDYRNINSKLEDPYVLATSFNIASQVQLAALAGSNYPLLAWLVMMLVVIIFKGYCNYEERYNLGLLETLGVSHRDLLRMKLREEMMMLVWMTVGALIISVILCQLLGILNWQASSLIAMVIMGNAVVILLSNIIVYWTFIKKYPPASFFRKN